MDNACFQDEARIEMENVKLKENNSITVLERGKITLDFEDQLKANLKGEEPAAGLSKSIKTEVELGKFVGFCEPQKCREVNKSYMKIAENNKSFDPMLRLKASLFCFICFTLTLWSIIHFSAINSP